jgi:phage terminase large subunit
MKPIIKPTEKQHLAWLALKDKREIFFGGGAGGGKSWWLCESRLVNCYFYPGYKTFLARSELKRLMQSTYITFLKVCKHHGIPPDDYKLNGQYNFIEFKNGSRIDLLDLKAMPSDPLYERFGSLEYTDGAIDECSEVDELAFEVLKTRIGRHMNDEFDMPATIAMTGNPKKNWVYHRFYKPWNLGQLPDDIAFIQSLYQDNPYTSDAYARQLNDISDQVTRERLRDGNWDYDDMPDSLCSFDEINDLFSNDFVPDGTPAITADIAMMGSDLLVIGVWSGMRLIDITAIEKSSGSQIEAFIRMKAQHFNVSRSRIIFDADGIGNFLEGYLVGAKAFHANSRPRGRDKDEYQSLKDQCGYELSRAISSNEIYISDDEYKEKITEELSQLRSYRLDDDKKLRIAPKRMMKENLGRSPDFLDMMLMRMSLEKYKPKPINMSFINS